MEKETMYEWRDSMAACFRGTLEQCNNWANDCVKEGWLRVGNTMSHPNYGQVLTLVPFIKGFYTGIPFDLEDFEKFTLQMKNRNYKLG